MFQSRKTTQLLDKLWLTGTFQTCRNVNVSVIGAAGEVGSNVALLLKQNPKIKSLKLYDDNLVVKGIGCELDQIPAGPIISAYSGHSELKSAISASNIIAIVSRVARKPGKTRNEMLAVNAYPLQTLCKIIVEHNPNAFVAISTNPINSIYPFLTSMFKKHQSYNPFKLLGITNIDSARSRSFAGEVLDVSPNKLSIPVIGGHSDQTIVPLFSNIKPSRFSVDICHADTLTRLVRKAGTEVVLSKRGNESSTITMAWSVNEFLCGLVDAVKGKEVFLNCFTANPYFGTRFFSGPTKVGPNGVIETFFNYPMSELETYLMNSAIPVLNKEIEEGEAYVNYVLGL